VGGSGPPLAGVLMSVRIRHFDSRETGHRRHQLIPVTTATSQTRRPFALFKPGAKFLLHGINLFCRTEAGAVTVDAFIVGDNEILQAGALSIGGTAEEYQIAAGRYVVAATIVEKAADTGEAFTAAHTINTGAAAGTFWGAILIQLDAAGALSSKVVSADQVYATSAAAIAALPAADASKIALGYVLINSKTNVAWTGNTDDLTNGSDVTTAAFVTYAATVLSALASAAGAVTKKNVEVAHHATIGRYRDVTGDKAVLLEYTSDGSGALTDGVVDIVWRPIPMSRDKSLGIL
jgi:hypothetical protein